MGKKKERKTDISFKWAFKEYIWPRKKLVGIGLFLIVIRSFSGLVLPYTSKALLDDVIPNKNGDLLGTLVIITVTAIVIQAVTSFTLTRLLSVEAQRLISILRTQVQRKLLALPIRFFDDNKSGALVSRVMTDVEGVRNLVGTGLVQLVGGTL